MLDISIEIPSRRCSDLSDGEIKIGAVKTLVSDASERNFYAIFDLSSKKKLP